MLKLRSIIKPRWILGIAVLLNGIYTSEPGDEVNELLDGKFESGNSNRKKDNKCLDTDSCEVVIENYTPLTREFDVASLRDDPMKLAKESLLRYRRLTQRRKWTKKDREAFDRRPLSWDHDKLDYELEVREAQNSSVCNYTVIPIPDSGGRIPRKLEHVKCNHVGSRCRDLGTYCCIQLYRYVEVFYEEGRIETMKIYFGCVCTLQIYGYLEPYTLDLEINY